MVIGQPSTALVYLHFLRLCACAYVQHVLVCKYVHPYACGVFNASVLLVVCSATLRQVWHTLLRHAGQPHNFLLSSP